jgi:hypothetical protein
MRTTAKQRAERKQKALEQHVLANVRVPPMRVSWSTQHPGGGDAETGNAFGDELMSFSLAEGRFAIAEKLRLVAAQFAGHQRPEDIEAHVFILIRRKGAR